jgi:hypothetical protein
VSGGCVGAGTLGVGEMLETRLSGSLGCWKGDSRKLEDALLFFDTMSKPHPLKTGSATKGRLVSRRPEEFLFVSIQEITM